MLVKRPKNSIQSIDTQCIAFGNPNKKTYICIRGRVPRCEYGKGYDHKNASEPVGGRQCRQLPAEHDRIQSECDRFRTARDDKRHGADHSQSGVPAERPRRQLIESEEPDAWPRQDGGEQVGSPETDVRDAQDRRGEKVGGGPQSGGAQGPRQQRGQARHALRGGDDREGCLSGGDDGQAEESLRQGA